MASIHIPSVHGREDPRPASFDWKAHELRIVQHQRRVRRHLAREKLTRDGCSFTVAEWSILLDIPEHEVHKRLRSPEPL
jgi:hypothetical protein